MSQAGNDGRCGDGDIFQLGRKKGFKIIHQNIRSVLKKIDQLRVLFVDSGIEVITLSETWLNENISPSMVHIEGYETFRMDRECLKPNVRRAKCNARAKKKKRGGGLLTYVSHKYSHKVKELPNLCLSNGNIEMHGLQIRNDQCKNIVVCNLYRPPKGNLDLFIKQVDECLDSINLKKNDIFILGDWNVDYKNVHSIEYKKVHFFEKSNHLSQVVKNTTRNTQHSKTLLDLIMTNSPHVHSYGTLENNISDHQMTYAVRKKMKETFAKQVFYGRSYKSLNDEVLIDNLASLNWDDYFRENNVDKLWDFLEQHIKHQLDLQCPIRKFVVKNYRPSWMSAGLIEQIKNRDYFYKKAKKSGSADDWNIARHLRNTTNSNIRQAKADFILSQLELNKNDNPKFWKNIKEIFPNKKSDTKRAISLTNIENNTIVPESEVPQYINNFFINV